MGQRHGEVDGELLHLLLELPKLLLKEVVVLLLLLLHLWTASSPVKLHLLLEPLHLLLQRLGLLGQELLPALVPERPCFLVGE